VRVFFTEIHLLAFSERKKKKKKEVGIPVPVSPGLVCLLRLGKASE
jgi:hypothetical protein